ncbi:MAG: 50S ribosomal protein L24 [Alphaproteobacteria bacterium]
MTQPKYKIRKGDTVVVLSGRDKGRRGEVIRMVPTEARAFVRGVHMIKRHQAPTRENPGGILEREGPIHVSNLAIADPKDGRPTRVGYTTLTDGRKVRVARRSGEQMDK